ncbi:MAG TPA: carboxypeptidase-like regulatory domain-containing protein [Thermoguttaceae bacterium]|nr:carboxypeptidase-like regulatory domain-containing protein [Thermoguttaceae bacterium]
MSLSRLLARACVVLATLGLMLPGSVLEGAQPFGGTLSNAGSAGDIELDPEGVLHGVVVNVQGVPVARMSVLVHNAAGEVAAVQTDASGRFSVAGLPGGTYRVSTGGFTREFRTWVAGTAPPRSRQIAAIVVGGDVVRGQMPLGDFFRSDAFLLTALVSAAIAIPIAVHNSKSRAPSSP